MVDIIFDLIAVCDEELIKVEGLEDDVQLKHNHHHHKPWWWTTTRPPWSVSLLYKHTDSMRKILSIFEELAQIEFEFLRLIGITGKFFLATSFLE